MPCDYHAIMYLSDFSYCTSYSGKSVLTVHVLYWNINKYLVNMPYYLLLLSIGERDSWKEDVVLL